MIGRHYAVVPRETPNQPAFELENGAITGKEIARLMRVHRVKIRELSLRMGITMKRIREVRDAGLSDPLSIRDWIEAITGSDPGRL